MSSRIGTRNTFRAAGLESWLQVGHWFMQKVCVEIGHIQVTLSAARQNVIDLLHPANVRWLEDISVLQAMPTVNVDHRMSDQRGQAAPADDHATDQWAGLERAALVLRHIAQLHAVQALLAQRVHEDEVRLEIARCGRDQGRSGEQGPVLEALQPDDGHASQTLLAQSCGRA